MNIRRLSILFLAGASLTLTGCATNNAATSRTSDSPIGNSAASSDAGPIERALALRSEGRNEEAVAVLQKAVVNGGGSREVQAAYGKSLISVGRFKEAKNVLTAAHTADKPDPLILSALGTIEDQTGNHAAARAHYAHALKILPGDPRILSNLGMSYVLTKELDTAERYMQQAAEASKADDRVRRNLELVLDLQKQGQGKGKKKTG